MTLAIYQNAFRDLLMTSEGKQALNDADALKTYLATTGLSAEQQQDFLKQPLDRLQQYQYMAEANVREVVKNIYPFTLQVLGDAWDDVYQGYFSSHPSQVYHLMGCAEALPGYLESREDLLATYPYLAELALYEWVEAELLGAEDVTYPKACQPMVPETIEDLSLWAPVRNTTSLLLPLTYNIPQLIEQLNSEKAIPAEEVTPRTTWILVYREVDTLKCRFFQLTPVLAAWLGLLEQADDALSYEVSLGPVLEQLKQAGVIPSDTVFYESLLGMLPELLSRQVLMGSQAV